MKWVLAESDNGAAAALAESAGLHPLIARLLVNRGISDPSEASTFLACDLSAMSDPGIFSQMEKAVGRIRSAIAGGEKIVVYGDYDVDGVTGASLLFLALQQSGAKVDCYIPDRMTEGYGLNAKALETLKTAGTQLVISVDCGITAVQESRHARSIGLDLIITDHHEFDHAPAPERGSNGPDDFILPNAYAVLHPGLLSSGVSPALREFVSGLTGVGVAFKLAQAFLGASSIDERLMNYLDLVTLGTIADVGRITGENRILVRHGLDRLSSDLDTQRPGIAALKQVSGLNNKKIGVGIVGFTLAPRINASGRMERADAAFQLLTTSSPEEALKLASALDAVNRERQSVELAVWEDARGLCRAIDTDAAGALVLSSGKWHAGVIGIVASRIVEEFYRPTALICVRDGVGKGSARSIPGFDLYEGLVGCSDLLLGFGGHKYAAGFTLAEDNIPRFRERLSALVLERIGPEGFVRTLSVDGAVSLDELTRDLMAQIEKLGPFGQGNPEPRLGARDLSVVSSRIVGKKHLKLRLRQSRLGRDVSLDAIMFKGGHLLGKKIRDGSRLAAVFTPRLNVWNGNTTVELELRDIKVEK
ncbi:MAG: single-stranded-DNA-specific exonuclease RecJ [Nitrospirae bacterium]|nr:single-stranded-DNA-specific exonuclease RecJ [Nitrospirota bacterium]